MLGNRFGHFEQRLVLRFRRSVCERAHRSIVHTAEDNIPDALEKCRAVGQASQAAEKVCSTATLGFVLFVSPTKPHRQECLCYLKPPEINFFRSL